MAVWFDSLKKSRSICNETLLLFAFLKNKNENLTHIYVVIYTYM